MTLGDLHLLLLGVPGDPDDLHAITQRRADRLGDVRGRDEQDLREVVRDLEVVVAELPVLLRIEDLEQRCGRIAAEVRAHLVDLVEHDHRVARARRAHRLDDPAGQRPDVRAPVPANLGLIPDATQATSARTSDPMHEQCDRPSDVLPTPGGPTKHSMGVWSVRRFVTSERRLRLFGRIRSGWRRGGQRRSEGGRRDVRPKIGRHRRPDRRTARGPRVDRTRALRLGLILEPDTLANGQPFKDAVLHLGQAVVVLVENRGGAFDVEGLGRRVDPRQVEQPVDPGADHSHLGRGARDLLEAVHLLEHALS